MAHVVDDFLVSASKVFQSNVLAGLLSGGPGIGVEGLRAVRQAGGLTVVQEPELSVDPRMAEGALQKGIVDYRCSVDSLGEIFRKIRKMSAQRLVPSP
jgi:two-component system chemotaxis response regulator CheB